MNKFHGTVKAIREYGVMVENHEYKDCLLHISDISWRKLKYTDLLKMFEIGEQIRCTVIRKVGTKVSLSMKNPSTIEELIENLHAEYKVGDIIKRKILYKKDYGIFIEIMDGIEGMLHYSEFTPSEYYNLSEGQEISVGVKDLTDFDKHRRVVLEKV